MYSVRVELYLHAETGYPEIENYPAPNAMKPTNYFFFCSNAFHLCQIKIIHGGQYYHLAVDCTSSRWNNFTIFYYYTLFHMWRVSVCVCVCNMYFIILLYRIIVVLFRVDTNCLEKFVSLMFMQFLNLDTLTWNHTIITTFFRNILYLLQKLLKNMLFHEN